MPKPLRIVAVLVGMAIVGVLCAIAVANFTSYPPTEAAPVSDGQADLTLQTVGTIGFGVHPTWVSYLMRNAAGKWVHTTVWTLPANSIVHVTVYEYDTLGPLRNELWGEVEGVQGNKEILNGKPLKVANANGSTAPGHTFTVPNLGIDVPLVGVPANAKNQCAVAPCTLSEAHNVIKFSFKTPGPGLFRWQCFVPCGLGFLDGNGGPMSTLGYMGGYLKIVGT